MVVTSVFLKLLKAIQSGGGGVYSAKYLNDLSKVLKSLGQMLRVSAFLFKCLHRYLIERQEVTCQTLLLVLPLSWDATHNIGVGKEETT